MVSVYYFKLQYYVPNTIDIVLHYRTVFYFFVVFVFFVPYTNTECGGDMNSVGMLDMGGGGGDV